MQKTQTATGDREPVITAGVNEEYGKIMLIFLKYPMLKAYNHKWNDPRMCEDIINGTKFNFYIGKKCVSRMSELKRKGFVISEKDPDSRNHLYSWNHNYQIILTDKGLEIYNREEVEKKLTWIEQTMRDVFGFNKNN